MGFFFSSLGFSLGPRDSMYGSRTQRSTCSGTHTELFPSSPCCIKRRHNYMEHALRYCSRHLTYTWGKTKARTSQDRNVTGTPPSNLHFMPEEQFTEAHSLKCYLWVKSSLIQLYVYPYHNKLQALLLISVAQWHFLVQQLPEILTSKHLR